MNFLPVTIFVVLGLVVLLLLSQFRKLSDLSRKETDLAPVLNNLSAIEKGQEQIDRKSAANSFVPACAAPSILFIQMYA